MRTNNNKIKENVDILHETVDIGGVLKEDLERLLADCERETELVQSVLSNPAVVRHSEVTPGFKNLLIEIKADELAIQRVIARIDRLDKSKRLGRILPQTVTERVREYVRSNAGPFTVKQVADHLNSTGVRVSETAVSMALRRMVDDVIRIAKRGEGPNPTHYERIAANPLEALPEPPKE